MLVDDTLQTFDPSIYAVGECVQRRNTIFGLVAPLWEQARVCAAHLAEVGVRRYHGSLTATQLKVTGIEVYSAGNLSESEGCESLVMRDRQRGIYKRLVIRNNRLQGVVLYGDAALGSWYFDLIASRAADGVIEITGDPRHPANRGGLCSKGAALAETLGTEGRLLHPLIRTRRGSLAQARQVGWDEALSRVAQAVSAPPIGRNG